MRPAPETPEHASATIPDGFDEAAREQRCQREADRGRVATRVGDVHGRRELRPVQLDEPERERVDELGGGVGLAVPLLVRTGREPEVGAEVDDVRDLRDHRRRDPLRLAVRQREEHHVEPGQVGRFERPELETPVRGSQRREELADAAARVGIGGHVHRVDLGVAGEQPQQLGPRVP